MRNCIVLLVCALSVAHASNASAVGQEQEGGREKKIAGNAKGRACNYREGTQVGVGYSVLRQEPDTPIGWGVGVTHDITSWAALTAQVDGNYLSIAQSEKRTTQQNYSFLDGPTFTIRTCNSELSLFGQVLVGVSRITHDAGTDSAANRFTVQPGVGVDVKTGKHAAVRFEVNWRDIHNGDAFWQFISGIVFR